MMLLGNPLSGAGHGARDAAGGWGAFGQLLPPGATGTLLRSVAFFDGAAVGGPLTVLLQLGRGGALLMGLGRFTRKAA